MRVQSPPPIYEVTSELLKTNQNLREKDPDLKPLFGLTSLGDVVCVWTIGVRERGIDSF